MSSTTKAQVRQVSWQTHKAELRVIRETVFMQEQSVPEALEWDGLDAEASHFLATIDGLPVGTARLLSDGHIGRMAVLADWRKQGIGSALLSHAIEAARRQGLPSVFLDAQIHALTFYELQGFIAEGEVFMDAGIPHRHMSLSLT